MVQAESSYNTTNNRKPKSKFTMKAGLIWARRAGAAAVFAAFLLLKPPSETILKTSGHSANQVFAVAAAQAEKGKGLSVEERKALIAKANSLVAGITKRLPKKPLKWNEPRDWKGRQRIQRDVGKLLGILGQLGLKGSTTEERVRNLTSETFIITRTILRYNLAKYSKEPAAKPKPLAAKQETKGLRGKQAKAGKEASGNVTKKIAGMVPSRKPAKDAAKPKAGKPAVKPPAAKPPTGKAEAGIAVFLMTSKAGKYKPGVPAVQWLLKRQQEISEEVPKPAKQAIASRWLQSALENSDEAKGDYAKLVEMGLVVRISRLPRAVDRTTRRLSIARYLQGMSAAEKRSVSREFTNKLRQARIRYNRGMWGWETVQLFKDLDALVNKISNERAASRIRSRIEKYRRAAVYKSVYYHLFERRIKNAKDLQGKTLSEDQIEIANNISGNAFVDAATMRLLRATSELIPSRGRGSAAAKKKTQKAVVDAFERMLGHAELDARKQPVELARELLIRDKVILESTAGLPQPKRIDPVLEKFIKPKIARLQFRAKSIKLYDERVKGKSRQELLDAGSMDDVKQLDRKVLTGLIEAARSGLSTSGLSPNDELYKGVDALISRCASIATARTENDFPLLYQAGRNLQSAFMLMTALKEVSIYLENNNYRKITGSVSGPKIQNLRASYDLMLKHFREFTNPHIPLAGRPNNSVNILIGSLHETLPRAAVEIENAYVRQMEYWRTQPSVVKTAFELPETFKRSMLAAYSVMSGKEVRPKELVDSERNGLRAAELLRSQNVSIGLMPRDPMHLITADTAKIGMAGSEGGGSYNRLYERKREYWDLGSDMMSVLGYRTLKLRLPLLKASAINMANKYGVQKSNFWPVAKEGNAGLTEQLRTMIDPLWYVKGNNRTVDQLKNTPDLQTIKAALLAERTKTSKPVTILLGLLDNPAKWSLLGLLESKTVNQLKDHPQLQTVKRALGAEKTRRNKPVTTLYNMRVQGMTWKALWLLEHKTSQQLESISPELAAAKRTLEYEARPEVREKPATILFDSLLSTAKALRKVNRGDPPGLLSIFSDKDNSAKNLANRSVPGAFASTEEAILMASYVNQRFQDFLKMRPPRQAVEYRIRLKRAPRSFTDDWVRIGKEKGYSTSDLEIVYKDEKGKVIAKSPDQFAKDTNRPKLRIGKDITFSYIVLTRKPQYTGGPERVYMVNPEHLTNPKAPPYLGIVDFKNKVVIKTQEERPLIPVDPKKVKEEDRVLFWFNMNDRKEIFPIWDDRGIYKKNRSKVFVDGGTDGVVYLPAKFTNIHSITKIVRKPRKW